VFRFSSQSVVQTNTSVPASVLPELEELHRLIELGGADLDTQVMCKVQMGSHQFDVLAITMGSRDPAAPAIGFFGGVHGLERIGAEVVLAYLGSLVHRLKWDNALHALLRDVRLVFMPLVNPGGLWQGTRANPHGVDLMRNAPIDAKEDVPFLIGGQRLSATLPWYRGPEGAPMQEESYALCQVVEQNLLPSPFSAAIDCHSGFGVQDRIWFPFAHTAEPLTHLAELHALHRIFDQTHAHHRYVFEPQSVHYLTHGDLWDHLYLLGRDRHPHHVFLPLTLEMGSWIWVKKNPRQLFTRHGIFNPLIAHRQQRVLRRHMALLDFMTRAVASHSRWQPDEQERDLHHRQALARWYPDMPKPKRSGIVRPK
jgi:hypothetical protein